MTLTLDKLDSQVRSAIRRHFRVHNHNVPITIGDKTQLTGEEGGWFTRGGSPISHPSAYSRHGWSNMEYHIDEREITVTPEFVSDLIKSGKVY